MKINLPRNSERTPSPTKRGRSSAGSDKRSSKKGAFPTTPRSLEKQRKIIANTLRIEMDTNIRYKAHNRQLKDANRTFLDSFAMKDEDFQKHKKLNSNARREIDYKAQLFQRIK